MPTEILTERLILRSFEKSDLDDFYNYAKNPNVGPHAGWNPHTSPIESQKILDMFMRDNYVWAIVWKKNNRVIGSIGVDPDYRRKSEQAFQVGYSLAEDYWGKGIMTESTNAVKVFAFRELSADILSIYHCPENIRSRRVIEKCGFSYEGTLRRAFTTQSGEVRDECCYSMLKSEFSY